MIKSVDAGRFGRIDVVIENFGGRSALGLAVSVIPDEKLVIGGLRSGECVSVGLSGPGLVHIDFVDAGGGWRRISRTIGGDVDAPFLEIPAKPSRWVRLKSKIWFGHAD